MPLVIFLNISISTVLPPRRYPKQSSLNVNQFIPFFFIFLFKFRGIRLATFPTKPITFRKRDGEFGRDGFFLGVSVRSRREKPAAICPNTGKPLKEVGCRYNGVRLHLYKHEDTAARGGIIWSSVQKSCSVFYEFAYKFVYYYYLFQAYYHDI